ncbi:cell division protein DivIB [Enterococcus saigonensis]|uniref:Cell division protein DivIB n=1 Tax=Enterococcus saigonensis TaxID=1805431 RepID=A0A679INE4_9ENTE|nr:cell division protein FtsQ/DivIB [Enterococcus saigonensis]BCA85314.1 cell division protein DivIB [Enterococcus saigonensis]
MTHISKKDQSKQKRENSDVHAVNLTPWQKANLEYRKKNGQDAPWSPTVIEGQEQKEELQLPENASDLPVEGGSLNPNGSFADRLPKLKYERNAVLYRRLAIIITLFLIPLLFALYYVSPLSKLSALQVAKNNVVSKAAIIKAADFKLDEGLWKQYWYRNNNEEKIKKALPRVKSVAISIEHFNEFKLAVTEYQEVAILEKGDSYAPVIENGKVLAETVKEPAKNLPILEDFKSQKRILDVLTQYQKLSQELRSSVSQIKYTPTNANKDLLNLLMNDGNTVIINISNLAEQLKYYPQVAKELKGKGVVDMEVGIFTYPYPKDDKKADTKINGNSATTESNNQNETNENTAENESQSETNNNSQIGQ